MSVTSLISSFAGAHKGIEKVITLGGIEECITADGVTKLGPKSNGGGSGCITQDGTDI